MEQASSKVGDELVLNLREGAPIRITKAQASAFICPAVIGGSGKAARWLMRLSLETTALSIPLRNCLPNCSDCGTVAVAAVALILELIPMPTSPDR